ncbi:MULTISPECIES: TetR/AcrR family transcriptional regulator [unclassified Micromonospora]|uniref:TetR/AcrR family transcriptional regulator n=1 Tax=unclassified Micromonospora TaxID=2617518 RepID=UPI001375A948|nr:MULTISPECIES: TetR/AcrR family transcriptional regulator [unclassified Micromonospora]QKW13799.1 TetR/AcrR family transcriptional regulator [Verrucosispora sp. NA02020]
MTVKASAVKVAASRVVAAPAQPRTPAQHDRRSRVLASASAMLATGGEDALQMKRVAEDARVSLATVYRYFPSKDHLLLAMARARFERALVRVQQADIDLAGSTAGERVSAYLLREFAAQQRQPHVTSALARVLIGTNPDYRETHDEVQQMHLRLLSVIAHGHDSTPGYEAWMVLRVVAGCFGSATRNWIAGLLSADEARFEIALACRLLDLPPESVGSRTGSVSP